MSGLSATVRLALLVFACQLLAAALLLGGVGTYIRWQSANDVAKRIEQLREDLLSVYGREGATTLARVVAGRAASETDGAVLLLADRAYRPVAGNLTRWPAGVDDDPRTSDRMLVLRGAEAAQPARMRSTRLPDGTHLLTGAMLDDERRAIAVVGEASAAVLALALLLAVAAALAAMRMFAARLSEPRAALEAAQHGDLSRRVTRIAGDDSFAALAHVVNATLSRLETLVGELTFAADAMAHDLKSPLTRLSSALDRGDVARAQAEANRLTAIVGTALSIRRAEAGLGRDAFVTVDLVAMLSDLAEIYGPLAEDADRAIVVVSSVPVTLPVHRELLGQAIGNLIDNALKYGAGTIRLSAAADAAGVCITVRDEGSGIAAESRGNALRRFGRLDAARSSDGAGLGLSLVAAVATLHDGRLALADAAPGLSATLVLPRTDTDATPVGG